MSDTVKGFGKSSFKRNLLGSSVYTSNANHDDPVNEEDNENVLNDATQNEDLTQKQSNDVIQEKSSNLSS